MLSLNELTTATVVLAYDEAEQKHANQPNINKLERYPQLSEQIKRLRLSKSTAPVWFDKRMKGAFKALTATTKVYEVKITASRIIGAVKRPNYHAKMMCYPYHSNTKNCFTNKGQNLV